jgi:hypothetical protein
MSGLASLPAELLHDIFSYVYQPSYGSASDRYQAFAELARSCRSLNQIATEYLHTRYEAPFEQPITGFLRRLSNNSYLCHHVKDIKILSSTEYEQRGRLRRELKARIAQLPDPFRSAWTSAAQNLALRNEVELAILILEAQNVESLCMAKNAERTERRFDNPTEPPVWLLPLTNAGQSYIQTRNNPQPALPYQTLHTLSINLQSTCPPSLINLFSLPALKHLHMRNLLDHAFLRWIRGWEDQDTYTTSWPYPPSQPSSSITNLELENVHIPSSTIASLIHTCKALHQFSYIGVETPECVSSSSRQWCAEILSSLLPHKYMLQHLRLDPGLLFQLRSNESWPRISGFEAFEKLRSLDTTFGSLAGHPRGRLAANGLYRFASDWEGWPALRNVIPDGLERLGVRFDGDMEVNCDELILGLLDTVMGMGMGRGATGLKSLDMYYQFGNMFLDTKLTHPLNFWDVQRAFREDGRIAFTYTKGFDLWGDGEFHVFHSSLLRKT